MHPADSSLLSDRALLEISGNDAIPFLSRVVTNDIEQVEKTGTGFGALLSAQGKIVADFLMVRLEDSLLIDVNSAVAADLSKKLGLYKLRAAVSITDVSAKHHVVTNLAGSGPEATISFADPRHPDLGTRHYIPATTDRSGTSDAYSRRRVELGIAELVADYLPNDLYPHDAALDQVGGVAFAKGCYVGQEVVSRMEHRGTARRRPVCVSADVALPARGTTVTCDGKLVGELGSSIGNSGIAILRLDRAAAAMRAGAAILADGISLDLALPSYARYDWPADIAD